MKKILLILGIILLTGCNDLSNTPTKKVEAYLKKYQTLDASVLRDLDKVVAEETAFNSEQREKYRDIMKKHYQNLAYEIKEETVDGNSAVVKVKITVTDFAKTMAKANQYLQENPKEFQNEAGEHDVTKYTTYRLEELKKTTEKVEFTIDFRLTKTDKEWNMDQVNSETLSKINGMYVY